MSEKIRVGFIGCGQIARQHLTQYAKMREQVEVVALCDINPACVEQVGKEFGVPGTGTSFRKLLERDDVDAVDVCLHNNFHRPATEAALRAGKHVYCEKPMAGSYADAAAMLKTAKESGKKLAIQLSTIYEPQTRAAKELIEAGELGDLYYARSTGFRRRGRAFVDGYGSATFVQKRYSAGGALYDMGVYHISQVLYLLGNPKVRRISGKAFQKTAMDPKRRSASGYDVEELGIGLIRFDGDLVMDLVEAWAIHLDSFEGSYVVGDKGGVRLHPFGFFRTYGQLDISGSANLEAAKFKWNNVVGDGEYYAGPQQHWIAALQGKVELLPTAEIALSTMLISEGIYLSSERGCEVSADEVVRGSKSTAVEI